MTAREPDPTKLQKRPSPPSADTPGNLWVVSSACNAPLNPYGRLLADAVEDADAQFRVTEFQPRNLFALRPPALCHFHWPENVATQPNALRAVLDVSVLAAAIWRARRRRIPVVWTVHNDEPHEPRRRWLGHHFMDWFAEQVDGWISLSRAGAQTAIARFPILAHRSSIVVPHGHYADWYGPPPSRPEARAAFGLEPRHRLLLALGRIRPYKGVEQLVAAFTATNDPNLRLFVGGEPEPDALGTRIHEAASHDNRIMLRLEKLPDPDLAMLLTAADGFVLPGQQLLNSGSTVLALSYGLPALVPDTAALRDLQTTVGTQAVRLHTGSLTAASLETFLDSVGDIDRRQIMDSFRASHDWTRIGGATAEFYTAMIQNREREG